MPTPAYMSIEGTSQGNITGGAFTADSVGNIYQEGHEDEVLVQAFEFQATVPRDPQNGQPAGDRVYDPVVITKIFDKSSPLLYQAMSTGERLTRVEIKWYRTNVNGQKEHYFSHVLEDAVIVQMEQYMPNCQDPGMGHFTHLEKVAMTFRKIRWEHMIASTAAEDDWRVPSTVD
jgi:type VI secretion system secreted protein Hcp